MPVRGKRTAAERRKQSERRFLDDLRGPKTNPISNVPSDFLQAQFKSRRKNTGPQLFTLRASYFSRNSNSDAGSFPGSPKKIVALSLIIFAAYTSFVSGFMAIRHKYDPVPGTFFTVFVAPSI